MPLKPESFRRRPVALTPLIDIIFLLLLFFMLSSTFTRFAEVPLMNAGGGASDGATPLFVQLGPEDVTVNGTPLPIDALLPALRAIAADGDAPQTVLLTLQSEVSSQRLVDALTELRRTPEFAVSVLE